MFHKIPNISILFTRRTKLSQRPNRYFIRYNIIIFTRNTITSINTIPKSNFTNIFPLNISHDIETRYSEQPTNIPIRFDWNTFIAPPPLLGQHNESHRLHSWALSRLQYRQDIHEDIREHNVQILNQNSLQLKFEITVKLNNIFQHPYPLSPSNITAQTKPPPFITTEVRYKYDRYTKTTIGYIKFYNAYSGLSYKCIF